MIVVCDCHPGESFMDHATRDMCHREVTPNRNSLASTEYVRFELEQRLRNMDAWNNLRKVWELRKSCGLPPRSVTVRANLPPRMRTEDAHPDET